MEKQAELSQFQEEVLERHNELRSQHGVVALEMDDTLNNIANSRAGAFSRNESPSDDVMVDLDLNENKSTGYGGGKASGKAVVNQWYSEMNKYDFETPDINHANAHFCQVVWIATTKIGVGLVYNPDGSYKVSVVYQPKGNYKEELQENVLPPV